MPSIRHPRIPSASTPRRLARTLTVTAALVATAALTGCGAAASGTTEASATPTPTAAAYPLTVDNCGTEVTFAAAPERVVTIKSSTTELLLALGLGDRIVGTAFPDGPVPEEWAEAAADVPVLAEKVPSQEAVLGVEPDLVYAGWESNFGAEGAGDRASLAALGVNSYVSPSACKGEGYRPDPLTFDEVFAEIEQAGAIFDAGDAAAELVAEQQNALAAVEPDTRGLSALWFSSGSDTPYVGAGIGAPQLVLDSAGLENIAADVDDSWAPFSWEVVVERNPDVIVLVDSSWNSAQKKIGILEANPATAALPAVVNHRYITVPFAATEAGVRTAPLVADVVGQLDALTF